MTRYYASDHLYQIWKESTENRMRCAMDMTKMYHILAFLLLTP